VFAVRYVTFFMRLVLSHLFSKCMLLLFTLFFTRRSSSANEYATAIGVWQVFVVRGLVLFGHLFGVERVVSRSVALFQNTKKCLPMTVNSIILTFNYSKCMFNF